MTANAIIAELQGEIIDLNKQIDGLQKAIAGLKAQSPPPVPPPAASSDQPLRPPSQ
jgi:hypothetical protein